MAAIRSCELPPEALLRKYQQGGGFADCYVAEVAGAVSQAQFVEAFYTTALFKVERLILARAVAKPSTDAQAAALAGGTAESFAAWRVEGRDARQLLLADYRGRTRSWLMTAPTAGSGSGATRLYFGSAVVPVAGPAGERRLGLVFQLLLGFHRVYSRALLRAALARLRTAASRGVS
jgi:hypothetical protein